MALIYYGLVAMTFTVRQYPLYLLDSMVSLSQSKQQSYPLDRLDPTVLLVQSKQQKTGKIKDTIGWSFTPISDPKLQPITIQ